MTTCLGTPLRRPVVVSRSVPHRPAFGLHRPNRPPVARNSARWAHQKATMNQRGGSGARRLRATAARAARSLAMSTVSRFRSGTARAQGPTRADQRRDIRAHRRGSTGVAVVVLVANPTNRRPGSPKGLRASGTCLVAQRPPAARLCRAPPTGLANGSTFHSVDVVDHAMRQCVLPPGCRYPRPRESRAERPDLPLSSTGGTAFRS